MRTFTSVFLACMSFCCCGVALRAQDPPPAPKVVYEQGQLAISAENCALGDILQAVHTQIGATVEAPPSALTTRVTAFISPGDPGSVVADLLKSNDFYYSIVGRTGTVEQITLTSLATQPAQAKLDFSVANLSKEPDTSVQVVSQSMSVQPDNASLRKLFPSVSAAPSQAIPSVSAAASQATPSVASASPSSTGTSPDPKKPADPLDPQPINNNDPCQNPIAALWFPNGYHGMTCEQLRNDSKNPPHPEVPASSASSTSCLPSNPSYHWNPGTQSSICTD